MLFKKIFSALAIFHILDVPVDYFKFIFQLFVLLVHIFIRLLDLRDLPVSMDFFKLSICDRRVF